MIQASYQKYLGLSLLILSTRMHHYLLCPNHSVLRTVPEIKDQWDLSDSRKIIAAALLPFFLDYWNRSLKGIPAFRLFQAKLNLVYKDGVP